MPGAVRTAVVLPRDADRSASAPIVDAVAGKCAYGVDGQSAATQGWLWTGTPATTARSARSLSCDRLTLSVAAPPSAPAGARHLP